MLILRNPALIAFEAIAEMGTVHGAAKILGLTQTAVTLRLKNLESELSMTLFLRSRKGMQLTDEGKALLQLSKRQKELEGQFLSQVSGSSRSEISLTIVSPTSVISSRIIENCKHLYQKYPFLNLNLRTEDHLDLIELIKNGAADLAIVHPNLVPNEMDSKVLKSERYLLVGSPKWKGRKLSSIFQNERIIDFYETDKTTQKYLHQFNLEHLIQKKRLFVNNNECLINLFSAGVGFGTLVDSIAKPLIDSGNLIALNQAKTIENQLSLTWFPRPAKQQYFEDLIISVI